jgi:hypothetical protein
VSLKHHFHNLGKIKNQLLQYSSLREYFYKLHNLLYGIVLIPLLVFVVLYWQMQVGNIVSALKADEYLNKVMLSVFAVVVLFDWSLSMYLFNRGIKATRTLDSLGKKLDRYYAFTIFRFVLIVSGSLGLAIGFYLTENQAFTLLFVVSFVLQILFWPTPSKVCDDLQLKGDERSLVQYKKDRLH